MKASGGDELQFHAFLHSEIHAYVKLTACTPRSLVGEIEGIVPLILNLGTKSMHVLSLRPLWVYHLNVFNPYPTAFPYGNDMVLHFYQQQERSTTKTVHKVINKRLKTYV